jgi:hypothetical protein
MLLDLPEPAVARVLEALAATASVRPVRLACAYIRDVSYTADIALRVPTARVKEARALFPRSTRITVTGGTEGLGFLRGIRIVRIEMCVNTCAIPALDAERLVVWAPLASLVELEPMPALRDLELRSMMLDAVTVRGMATACAGISTLRVPLSRIAPCAYAALGALKLTTLDVSGVRTIPKLEIPTLERLRARFSAMQPGALSALSSLVFLDLRGALCVDFAGARSHRLLYLDIGDAGLPWAERECDAQPVGVCLCDGAHWRVGPCARYELSSSHLRLVTTLCLDRSLERAL